MSAFRRYAWWVLGYNLLVILWGAYVRATGSGAGCGNHWPLCNGEVLPRPERVETLIELSHRLTSGLDGLLVLGLAIWAFRLFPRRHPVRPAAVWSLFFLIVEALIGAGLVRFGLVGDDDSIARALVMAAHLVNTFLLLAALTLTAWRAGRGGREAGAARGRLPGAARLVLAAGFAALLVVGSSGAVAALGDTLFPAESFRAGLAHDLSPAAHLLVRLRVLHPVLAAVAALLLPAGAAWLARRSPSPALAATARGVTWLVAVQVVAGFVNLALAAPVWLQLVHLLLADLVWIAWVLLAAETAASPAASLSGRTV